MNSATVRSTMVGDVMVVTCIGLLTQANATRVNDALRAPSSARAAVVDLRLSVRVICEYARTTQSITWQPLPVAMVAAEVEMAAVREHCWHMAELGLRRAPFTCYEQALMWAQDQARGGYLQRVLAPPPARNPQSASVAAAADCERLRAAAVARLRLPADPPAES